MTRQPGQEIAKRKDQGLVKPDFVVVGGPYNDGVMLMASKELKRVAMLEVLVNAREMDRDITSTTPPVYEVTLSVVMKENYVLIKAPNYTIAWEELFRCWTPGADERSMMARVEERHRPLPQRQPQLPSQ